MGIGSSAGGLQALQAFVKNIIPDQNTAFVIVQHLKPDHVSSLGHILSRETLLPVSDIKDNDVPEGAHIYVLPAGYKLRLEGGVFKLEERLPEEIINKAINYFFITLAHELRSKAFGVILSGTGTDGVEGVKEIEKSGGIVLVQDPGSAQFDGMPVNTIHKDHPDFVLDPEQMPALISELQHDRDSRTHKRRSYE